MFESRQDISKLADIAGKRLAGKLSAAGIDTTYLLLTAVSQLLSTVTKVSFSSAYRSINVFLLHFLVADPDHIIPIPGTLVIRYLFGTGIKRFSVKHLFATPKIVYLYCRVKGFLLLKS